MAPFLGRRIASKCDFHTRQQADLKEEVDWANGKYMQNP